MSKKGMLYKIRRKFQVCAYDILGAETMSKIYFKIALGYKLNLKNPKTLNEKLQWLKLYEWPNNELVIQCADKYKVRNYIKKNGLEDNLNQLIGVYDNAEEIDFDCLPNQFALKCVHGCAYNIICDDKNKLNIEKTKKQLNKWIKEDFGKFNAEPHYSKIKPRIICEKYLGENMTDYKFFCFNGKVEFMYISDGFRDNINVKMTHLDKNGNIAPFRRVGYGIKENIKLPKHFEEMKKKSEILAKNFKFVRVDWFEVEDKIYFSELTFTPGGCIMKLYPEKYDYELGKKLKIE